MPANAPTIQAAIDMAANGDTVSVSPGTYYENINFKGKAITVTGAVAASASIIDGQARAAVVTFSSGEGRNSILSNLTIQNGSPTTTPEGGGIYINGASPTIQNDLIQNNFGCGIGSFSGAPLIQGNTIMGTTWGERQGCGENFGYTAPNTAQGSAILLQGTSHDGQQAQVIANIIEKNVGYLSTSGIYLSDSGIPVIANNIITGNRSNDVSAIAVQGDSAPVIVQNLIYGNVDDASQVVNAATGETAAIVLGRNPGGVFRNTPVIIANNTIAENTDVLFEPPPLGSQISMAGLYEFIRLSNNVIVGSGPTSAIFCGDPSPLMTLLPVFDHNDVFVSGSGAPYQGICPNVTGTNGNISVDPLFASGSAADQHPLQLQLQSPAVDSGDNTVTDLLAEDFLGRPRIQNAKGLSTPVIDMGVYEYPGIPAPPPPADFTLAASPATVVVTTAQSGVITITLTPTSSFQGTVALSCGTLPANVSCTFLPQQVAFNDGLPQTAQLTVAATQRQVAQGSEWHRRSPASMQIAGVLLPGIAGTFFLWWRRRESRRTGQFFSVLALVGIATTISACGVTYNNPPQNYTISVYGVSSSNQIRHQANITLTLAN